MLVGEKIGPFTVDKELGAGAMGAVYRAKHEDSGLRVAIKVMAPALGSNETAMLRFKKEADILKQLRHPNIVRLVAVGKFKGTPFYAMEYVEGESLDRVMARRGRMTWEEIVEIGKQLCAALKHAHDAGIVHRDLKPSNVMVLKDGTVKLTDFGIAKDLDATALTGANATVGTAAYMSPEQCRGEKNLSHKSDLYSLGVMFYELLTGKKPFDAESPMDMFMKHVHEPVVRPSRTVLEIPVWLDTLVCQLMEKKPEHRPFDAAMVADALERVREKVATQTSAGADTAKGRTAGRLDEEDREAARALRGKKKKKKKGDPFYRQRWFQGTALSVGILAILFVFYQVFLKAPSAESLYRQTAALLAKEDLDELVRSDSPLQRYLQLYGDRTDAQAEEMKQLAVTVPRDKAERDLVNRHRKQIEVNVDAGERLGRKAIDEEDVGRVEEAAKAWAALRERKDSSDPQSRTYYPEVAARRLKALAAVAEKEEALLKAALAEEPEAFKPADDQEKLAFEAVTVGLKEPAAARKLWEKLKASVEDERDHPSRRLWYVLAAKQLRQSPAPPKKEGDPKDQ